ncbi:MAG TPA: hypothetical protein VGM90_31880 [Kofleriaceae bacterium]
MVKPLHTAFASQALELADVFKMFVGSAPINGTDGRPFTAQLSTPDGPSTGGGVQHVQHITFSRDGRTFVVGSIDTKAQQIELRGLENVSRQHQQRFKAPLTLTAVEYDLFVKRVRAFANSKQMAVLIKEVVAPFSSDAPEADAEASSGSMAWLAWLLVILVAGAIAAVVVLT